MRKFNFLFLLLPLTGAPTGPRFLGTKTPYGTPAEAYTPAPGGFHPVFVDYVGRHGARYLTKAGADIEVLKVLETAAGSGGLTDLGQRVKRMVARLCEIEKGQYENITGLGALEQQAIGQRISDRYGMAFTGKGLDVVVTYKIRTQQSADAFLQAYRSYPGQKHYSKTADSLDAVLRFYDLSPAYQSYKKSLVLKKAADTLDRDPRTRQVAEGLGSRLFTAGYGVTLSTEVLLAFSDNLYDLYSVQFSLSEEIKKRGWTMDSTDLGPVFKGEELAWNDFRSGAQDFLEKGPGRDPLGIQVKVAAPLLADFIRTMDKAVVGATPDAILRFTHAEAISPFATLLGIPAASTPAASIYRYHDHWQAENIIPLSANIQWILYGNGKSFLVKVLLNEKEVLFPGLASKGAAAGDPAAKGPYYRWEDLRSWCLLRLQAVHADLEGNMVEYLKGLK